MTANKQSWELEIEQKIGEAENENLLREIALELDMKKESKATLEEEHAK